MKVKIKFKRFEISAILFIILIGLSMCCIAVANLFGNDAQISFRFCLITIILMAAMSALIYTLCIYMSRCIKIFNHIYALEIDDTGITNNISGRKVLVWNEIAYFSTATVQMTSGRHSKIYVHTYNSSLSMSINTNLLDIDKDEMLHILEQKLIANKLYNPASCHYAGR